MAFDEKLAARVRTHTGARTGIVEKKMFGGLAFLLNGNMCVGVHGAELIVRLDPGETDEALAEPDTRVFDITGRPMKGWILVRPEGVATDAALAKWIERAAQFAGALPAK